MNEMCVAIGFNVICLAINLVIVCVCGYDWTIKDKLKMIIGEVVFIALLTVGAMLMTYNK